MSHYGFAHNLAVRLAQPRLEQNLFVRYLWVTQIERNAQPDSSDESRNRDNNEPASREQSKETFVAAAQVLGSVDAVAPTTTSGNTEVTVDAGGEVEVEAERLLDDSKQTIRNGRGENIDDD